MPHIPYKHNFLHSFDEVRTLLVVVAMESEEQGLLDRSEFSTVSVGHHRPLEFLETSAQERRILVGRSGVGLVNAGVMLHRAADNYDLDAVIALGVGGALEDLLEPGDTVVATEVIQHDSVLSHEEGEQLIAAGELTISTSEEASLIDPIMRCDACLQAWLTQAMENSEGQVSRGAVLSGSEFVGSVERKRALRQNYPNALLVDMECAALAQLCRTLGLPFGAAKTVADRANPKGAVADDYENFLAAAAQAGRRIISALTR